MEINAKLQNILFQSENKDFSFFFLFKIDTIQMIECAFERTSVNQCQLQNAFGGFTSIKVFGSTSFLFLAIRVFFFPIEIIELSETCSLLYFFPTLKIFC